MKATEQYFPVVLFIMLHKVVLTFESVDEILNVTIKQHFLAMQFEFCQYTEEQKPLDFLFFDV